MKKVPYIIIIICIIIIVILISIIVLVIKSFNRNNRATATIDDAKQNFQNADNGEFMLDGPGSIHNFFRDKSFGEWEELIDSFYGNYYGKYNINVECKYNDDGDFIATVTTEYEVTAEYKFNEENGLAEEVTTGEVVDFENGRIMPPYSTDASRFEYIDFNDNECIAIGYVTDLNEVDFIDKYFPDGSYGSLPYYDYRHESNRTPGYGNKFVIIPMNNKVEITVYDCYIGDDGELYTDNTLISKITEPFILLDDYIEYTPSMCIKFEYNGFEEMFPITFSGKDGTLDLNGYEMEVKDISLY